MEFIAGLKFPMGARGDVLGKLHSSGVGVQEVPALGWEALLQLPSSTRLPPVVPGTLARP